MIEPENHEVPTRLDDKGKFLFFDYDVAMISLFPCAIGTTAGHFWSILGLALGIFLAMGYKSFKAGKHDKAVAHLTYWKTGWPKPKKLPESHNRNFYG